MILDKKISAYRLKCDRCGYNWIAVEKLPKVCSLCKSHSWNTISNPTKYDFCELECEQPTETEVKRITKSGKFVFGKTKKLKIISDEEYDRLMKK